MLSTSRTGFTLIELLVVISIIAILAAILLPTINLVRSAALTTRCASNLGQLYLAAGEWSNTHEEWLPPGRWQPQLQRGQVDDAIIPDGDPRLAGDEPGLARTLLCPAYLASGAVRPHPRYPTTYGLNQALYQASIWSGLNSGNNYGLGATYEYETDHGRFTWGSIRSGGHPLTEIVYFGDALPDPVGNDWWMSITEWNPTPPAGGRANYLHRGKANAVCLDGHVELVSQERMYALFQNSPH